MKVPAQLAIVPTWAWAVAGLGLAYFMLSPRKAASGAINLVGQVGAGLVDGAGGVLQTMSEAVLGVPQTDAQKCAIAQANGNTLDASFYCPAGTFIKGLFSSQTPTTNQTTAPVQTTVAQSTDPITLPGGGLASVGPSFADVVNWNTGANYGLNPVPAVIPQSSDLFAMPQGTNGPAPSLY